MSKSYEQVMWKLWLMLLAKYYQANVAKNPDYLL